MNKSLKVTSEDPPVLEQFRLLEEVPLVLRAELDRRTISFGALMKLDVGSLLVLSRPTGENIDLYAGEVMIGSGEILVVDASMAVRIADLREKVPMSTLGYQPIEHPTDGQQALAEEANGNGS
jgi:flagellar motor switch/type III secretory pathway protein FliN